MEANAGKSFQMQIMFNILPRISLHCKLVSVQYWEYEYCLFPSFPQSLSQSKSKYQIVVMDISSSSNINEN